MKALVCGSNGYIGTALVQKLLVDGFTVIGIDNDIKLNWLEEMESYSALPVLNIYERIRRLKRMGDYTHFTMDISQDLDRLKSLFKSYKFDTVVNLAQMPSAPYSQIDLGHASFTIQNNMIGTLNLIYMIKDYCPDAHYIEIESMGTYDHTIGVRIPEGKFQFDFEGKKSKPCIFPKQGGSQYHTAKIFSTYLLDNAQRWWGVNSTSINQGVVYGNWTKEIEESKIYSHLAYDSTFGTIVNRFIVQSLTGQPLTIYGKGEQKRGYLALSDSVQCLMLFINNPSTGFRLVNQLAETFSINDIANKIKKINPDTEFKYMESPRSEQTTDFPYDVSTNVLKSLGFKNTRSIDDELNYLYSIIDKKCIISLSNEKFVKWV